jgi:ubiquinone biosynthesis monooxygenase Coq7
MNSSDWPIDIQRILRVNHSGEFGAIGIYQAQLICANLVWPAGRQLLIEMMSHERRHLDIFTKILRQRGIRSCHALYLWRLGGWVLGSITSIFGRTGILVCTAAVESIVLDHLLEQRAILQGRDSETIVAISAIEADEQSHHDHGIDVVKQRGFRSRIIWTLATSLTRFAIWLSTKF